MYSHFLTPTSHQLFISCLELEYTSFCHTRLSVKGYPILKSKGACRLTTPAATSTFYDVQSSQAGKKEHFPCFQNSEDHCSGLFLPRSPDHSLLILYFQKKIQLSEDIQRNSGPCQHAVNALNTREKGRMGKMLQNLKNFSKSYSRSLQGHQIFQNNRQCLQNPCGYCLYQKYHHPQKREMMNCHSDSHRLQKYPKNLSQIQVYSSDVLISLHHGELTNSL